MRDGRRRRPRRAGRLDAAEAAARPEVGTVLAISTPFGPGDITRSEATKTKVRISDNDMSGLSRKRRASLLKATGRRNR